MISCVVNLSEGQDPAVVGALAALAGSCLLDLHLDPEHHRSVLTLASPDPGACETAARAVVAGALARLDLRSHAGLHPRLGVADVVPFVPLLPGAGPGALATADLAEAVAARDRFARWAGATLALPCFCYGPPSPRSSPGGDGSPAELPARTLPELRRRAFSDLAPDEGPPRAHPRAGACCVGARRVLLAYNLQLSSGDLALGRRLAAGMRSAEVRALAFPLTAGVQVSCNLVAPWQTGPREAYQRLVDLARPEGVEVVGAELVGLLPLGLLRQVPPDWWERLDLAEERTIEARLDRRSPARPSQPA